jgi:glycosyltransferase involved in cell wall biosynthesis
MPSLKCVALIVEDCRSYDGGSRIRDFEMLSALSSLGFLEVFTFEQRKKSARVSARRLEADWHVLPHSASGWALLKRLRPFRMYHTQLFDFSRHGSAVIEAINRADLIFFSMPYPGEFLALRNIRPAGLVLWDTQNFDPDTWRERFRTWPKRKKAVALLQYLQSLQTIQRVSAASDLVVACTQPDADKLVSSLGRSDVAVVPNGADVGSWSRLRSRPGALNHFGIFGSFTQQSTRDGALWFLEHVWPELLETLPSARLTLAGRMPPHSLLSAVERFDSVDLIQDPTDLPAAIAHCATILSPQSYGVGSKIKILEAISSGRPVIASPAATVGLTDSQSAGIFQAKTLADWVTLATKASAGKLPAAVIDEDVGWARSRQLLLDTIAESLAGRRLSQ